MITYGCDASRWQGLLDWRALRRKGIEFAALRATMGLSGLDPLYSAQRSAAEAAGVLVISYGLIYPRPGTGAAQAQHLVRTSGGEGGLDPRSRRGAAGRRASCAGGGVARGRV